MDKGHLLAQISELETELLCTDEPADAMDLHNQIQHLRAELHQIELTEPSEF